MRGEARLSVSCLAMRVPNIFFRPDHALNLAFFRILVFGIVLCWIPTNAVQMTMLPSIFRAFPSGYHVIGPLIPFDPWLIQTAIVLLIISCITGIIGLYPRLSASVAFITGLYVYGIPQFFGKINHESNHLFWFLLILAVTPCGDALSVSRLLKREKLITSASPQYGFPIRIVWLLIGLIYFFPGIWKIAISGVHWAFSDTVMTILLRKWYDLSPEFMLMFSIDQYPALLQWAAFAVLLFELTFVIGIFIPRLRVLWIIGGILFHASTNLFMGIPYWPLLLLYPVFIDWSGLITRRSLAQDAVMPKIHTILTALFLVITVIVCGLYRIHSWPFSVYPTFEKAALLTPDILEITARVNGEPTIILASDMDRIFGRSRWNSIQQRIIQQSSSPALFRQYQEGVAAVIPLLFKGQLVTDVTMTKRRADLRPPAVSIP